ncbi:MAG: UDP-glucose--LPS alpha 1,3-glucosyltransferase WaaG [Piscirickettsiaceae bacterium]|nr:MAG: UDP-glucose--LPS alpha 1,3-glucosyltransferase WaaG [Piscirickettsiaceae bacterium]
MRLAFALYKYFPYGGLARDFMRIANVCLKKGYTVDVYVMEWHGDLIAGCDTHVLNCSGWTNHAKVNHFHRQLSNQLKNEKYDVVIGFNKISNLDVYYAADPCYADKFAEKNFLHKLNPRYRFYAGVEESVFGIESKTVCLMISDIQAELFKKYYQIPNDHLVMLPPGIDPNRRRPIDADEKRLRFRHELLLEEQDLLVLMVGTGFKTKGVDRAMMALAELPKELLGRTKLMVVGEDDIAAYKRLANQIGVTENVRFMGGRPDVPAFLLAADLLLHPARKDNTGTVILEAMVAGLPMLVSEVCGYAKHVVNSNAGKVISAPFSQKKLNQLLVEMLSSNDKLKWSKSGLAYADTEDLYSMPEKAVAAIEKVARDKKNVD